MPRLAAEGRQEATVTWGLSSFIDTYKYANVY
jgi:hypothetical protein